MIVTSPQGNEYVVGELLGRTDAFGLYHCSLPGGSPGILKIASVVGYNGLLDREAHIMGTLWDQAERVEEEAREREPERGEMGYRRFFPRLVESFTDPDQGDRRITILDLSNLVEDISDLVPLGHLLSRERVRIDPKTSVWVLGKLLKLLHFIYKCGVSGAKIDGENILIYRERHFVALFDWTNATIAPGKTPDSIVREEIYQAAREVITALGGDPDTGELPNDPDLEDGRYKELILSFAQGTESDAGEAHERFYTSVRKIWPSKFHPFTAYPVKTTSTTASAVTDGEGETE
jgi:hypothetical protein